MVAALALATSLAFAGGPPPPQKIKQLSHTHPASTTYSYFCGKLRGKPGKKYVVEAIGPAVQEPTTKTVRMNDKGRAKASFKIDEAGPHEMVLRRRGKVIDSKKYTVPHGADAPVHGPFPCV